jgi:hypothetical protein
MKHDWRKAEKALYAPSTEPSEIDVPAHPLLSVKGEGSPDDPAFKAAIEILYSLSYALKFAPRKGVVIDHYVEYAVYPLEGLWDLKPEAYGKAQWERTDLRYTLSIRQPEFITPAHLEAVLPGLRKKNPHLDYTLVSLTLAESSRCVHVMHQGPFADESATFDRMARYCEEHGLERIGKTHREIYLSDFTKTNPQNLKTILRIDVKKR